MANIDCKCGCGRKFDISERLDKIRGERKYQIFARQCSDMAPSDFREVRSESNGSFVVFEPGGQSLWAKLSEDVPAQGRFSLPGSDWS